MSSINDILSYNYFLPQELIAKEPIMPKEMAKLLLYKRSDKSITHLKFGDLAQVIPEKTTIVFNDTKVIKARIYGKKDSGGACELLLNQPLGNGKFSCYIKGKVKPDTILNFDKGLKAQVIELKDDAMRIVKFYQNGKIIQTNELFALLQDIGHIPLPPYLKREDNHNDEVWYQSVFAKNDGAVAAPTASLHFSDEMLQKLKEDFNIHYLTLHVGAGTFKAVECEDIREHKMHSEFFNIPEDTINAIMSDSQILGVGTTVTRVIEYFARNKQAYGECDLFLNLNNPPIRQNFLLTNFHLPRSSLIMLVSSFIGLEETMRVYQEAIKNEYKFYSYGDAMVII